MSVIATGSVLAFTILYRAEHEGGPGFLEESVRSIQGFVRHVAAQFVGGLAGGTGGPVLSVQVRHVLNQVQFHLSPGAAY